MGLGELCKSSKDLDIGPSNLFNQLTIDVASTPAATMLSMSYSAGKQLALQTSPSPKGSVNWLHCFIQSSKSTCFPIAIQLRPPPPGKKERQEKTQRQKNNSMQVSPPGQKTQRLWEKWSNYVALAPNFHPGNRTSESAAKAMGRLLTSSQPRNSLEQNGHGVSLRVLPSKMHGHRVSVNCLELC